MTLTKSDAVRWYVSTNKTKMRVGYLVDGTPWALVQGRTLKARGTGKPYRTQWFVTLQSTGEYIAWSPKRAIAKCAALVLHAYFPTVDWTDDATRYALRDRIVRAIHFVGARCGTDDR